MMVKVKERGKGRREEIKMKRVEGKKGKKKKYRDEWLVGFKGNLKEEVWLGKDNLKKMKEMKGGVMKEMEWKRMME